MPTGELPFQLKPLFQEKFTIYMAPGFNFTKIFSVTLRGIHIQELNKHAKIFETR